jgi:hypothetical protein
MTLKKSVLNSLVFTSYEKLKMLNTGWAVLIVSLFQNEMRGKVTGLFSNIFLPQKKR